jgi:hypothetical protein
LANDNEPGTEQNPLIVRRTKRPGDPLGQSKELFILPDEAVSGQKPSSASEKPAALAKPDAPAQEGGTFVLPDDAITAVPPMGSIVQEASKVYQKLAGKQKDVDYTKGAPWAVRTLVGMRDNPEEVKATLARYYPPGDFGQDKGGRWWVKQDGQKVALRPEPDPRGSAWKNISNTLGNMGSDITASAAPTLGGIAGAIGGEIIAPEGGGIPGAMLGQAGGKALNEIVANQFGTVKKTPEEEQEVLAKEAAFGGAMYAIPPILQGGARGVGNFVRWWTHTTPETRAAVSRTYAGGAKAPLHSAAPQGKVMQREATMLRNVTGETYEKQNVGYLLDVTKKILLSEGLDDAAVDGYMGEILDRSAAMSGGRELGEEIYTAVQERIGGLRAEMQTARETAEAQLKSKEETLRRWAESSPARLGEEVPDNIIADRRLVSREFGKAYTKIDEMTGSAPVVSQDFITEAAKKFVDVTPPEAVPPIIKRLAEEKPGAMKTFEEAHELRTTLRDMSDLNTLTPDQRWHMLKEVAQAADEAISDTTGLAEQAAEELAKTDKGYKVAMAKFRDARIKKLVRDAKSNLVPDPTEVSATVFDDGNVEAVDAIMKMMPDDVKVSLRKTDMRNMISAATKPGPDNVPRLNGRVLKGILDSRKDVLPHIYSPGDLAVVDTLADELAARDAQVDVTLMGDMNPSTIIRDLTNAVRKEREIAEFGRSNPLAALASGNPDLVDAAADDLLKKGEKNLEAAMHFLGENSKEWQGIQDYALKRVLFGAVRETTTLNKTIVGESIDKALSQYTKRQQDLLFPDGLKDDLQLLARDAKFLFPQAEQDMSANLAAGAITGKFPWTIHSWGQMIEVNTLGRLARSRPILRILGDISRTGDFGWIRTTFPVISKALRATYPYVAKGSRATLRDPYLHQNVFGPGSGVPKAQDDAQKGRFGDTELVHVNPNEKAMLKARGGSGTINPATGRQEFFEPGPGGPGSDASGWGGGVSGTGGNDGRSAGDTSYSQSSTLGPYSGGAVAPSSPTSPVGGVGSGQWSGPGRVSIVDSPALTAPIADVPTPPARPPDALVAPTSAGLPSLVGAQGPNLTGAVPGFSNPNPYGPLTGLTGPTSASTGLDWGAPTSGTFPGQGPLGGYDPQPISPQSPAEYSAAMAALADAVKAHMGGLGNFSMPLSGGIDPRAAGLIK